MFDLTIEPRVTEIIHTGKQGPAGPSGSGGGTLTCNEGEEPVPSVTYRGKFLTVFGGDGVTDVTKVCHKAYDGTYYWRPILTGPGA